MVGGCPSSVVPSLSTLRLLLTESPRLSHARCVAPFRIGERDYPLAEAPRIPGVVMKADPRASKAFGISGSFLDDQVVLAIVGELDLFTIEDLAAVLDAVIDRGRRKVVLDLAGLEFMGAAVSAFSHHVPIGSRPQEVGSPSAHLRRWSHVCSTSRS